MEETITADTPIRTAAEDKLRRARFACRIADILSERFTGEGRVFAIRASWGDGKTSLKNLVIERLAKSPAHADWLDFNPWQWGDSDAIARALFQQIADKLGGPYSSAAARRAKKLRQYGAILTGVGEPLKSTTFSSQTISTVLASAAVVALAGAVGLHLPTAARIAGIMAVLAMILPFAGRLFGFLGKDRTSEPLDRIRRSLEESLQGLSKPLIVFVDDINRLEPDQIRLLFRQVKANANLPNIVFVMLFQPAGSISRRNLMQLATSAVAVPAVAFIGATPAAASPADRGPWDSAVRRLRSVQAEYDGINAAHSAAFDAAEAERPHEMEWFSRYNLGCYDNKARGRERNARSAVTAIYGERLEAPLQSGSERRYLTNEEVEDATLDAEAVVDGFDAWCKARDEAHERHDCDAWEERFEAVSDRRYKAQQAVINTEAPDLAAMSLKLEILSVIMIGEQDLASVELIHADAKRMLTGAH